MSFWNGLDVVQIHRAIGRKAICAAQEDFGWDAAHCGRDRRNCQCVQKPDRGIACQDQHRPAFVRGCERVPAHLAPSHKSPHACSDSGMSNSSG